MPDQTPLLQDVRWIVTTVIAVWGAALATWERFAKRRDSQPRLKVTLDYTPERDFMDGTITIRTRNVGAVGARLNSTWRKFEMSGQTDLIDVPQAVSYVNSWELASGDSADLTVPVHDIHPYLMGARRKKVNIRVCVFDAVDRKYWSNRITLWPVE